MTDARRTAILVAAARAIAGGGTRGIKVHELAREAGVSTALIYYHFGDRAGLLRQTLEFVNERAEHYTDEAIAASSDARSELTAVLLLELVDRPEVRENSAAWGELRASAVFEAALREPLKASTTSWNRYVATALARAQRDGSADPQVSAPDAAERLTALVEGLSERWLSGSMTIERARTLLKGAVDRELGAR